PVFDCNSLAQIDLNSDSSAVCTNGTDVTVPVAVDNCEGNISAVGTRSDNESLNAPWPVGTTTITWTFTDSKNNVASCTQDVVVTDNQAPVFDCNSLAQIDLNSDSSAVCTNGTDVTVPVAVDNCEGNISAVGTRSDNESLNAPWPVGTTTITWTFTDSKNNV
ncbi:HYR domain-containing protein, partial [Mariniflexile sp. HNIBRBA6329]|uniref:HYR domain-containing protein n=1 Tax=Mariniflexile sp. HNIBRBA6329 TaxID=3373088 RepID=UPI003746497A